MDAFFLSAVMAACQKKTEESSTFSPVRDDCKYNNEEKRLVRLILWGLAASGCRVYRV